MQDTTEPERKSPEYGQGWPAPSLNPPLMSYWETHLTTPAPLLPKGVTAWAHDHTGDSTFMFTCQPGPGMCL